MRAPALFLAALALTTCGTQGSPDPCAQDPASCMGTCTQQCAPLSPNFGILMVQLWSGPEGATPPACPEVASMGVLGYLDAPPATVTCSPACTCFPSANGCAEVSALTASTASCPAGTGSTVSLPMVWDGTCVGTSPVSQVSSLTTGPLPAAPGMCGGANVHATVIKDGKTRALTCGDLNSFPVGHCPYADQMCAYKKVDGFSVCLVDVGDDACPAGWPDKHLYFYDSDACQCTCGPATGESCSTTVTVFGDASCSTPLGSTSVSSSASACIDVPPGSTIAGVRATPPTYQAGTCTPMLTKSKVSTLCCLP